MVYERDDDVAGPRARLSRLSLEGPDHSLSVAAELAESSKSPMLLLPPLVEPEPETRLKVDEFALMSLSFCLSLSSRSLKIRIRASL